MKIKDLVEILEVNKKVPFHFTEFVAGEAVYEPIHCRFVSDAELENFFACGEDDDYMLSDLGVFLPDLHLHEIYLLEMEANSISTRCYMAMISEILDIPIEDYDLLYGIFVIYHEYGHWLHFRRCRKSNLEYAFWINQFMAPVEAQREILDMLPDADPAKEALVADHINAYNAMPHEFSANKYALKHLKDAYKKVKKVQAKMEG